MDKGFELNLQSLQDLRPLFFQKVPCGLLQDTRDREIQAHGGIRGAIVSIRSRIERFQARSLGTSLFGSAGAGARAPRLKRSRNSTDSRRPARAERRQTQ